MDGEDRLQEGPALRGTLPPTRRPGKGRTSTEWSVGRAGERPHVPPTLRRRPSRRSLTSQPACPSGPVATVPPARGHRLVLPTPVGQDEIEKLLRHGLLLRAVGRALQALRHRCGKEREALCLE